MIINNSKIKVVVFDWDGTLFDSMGYKPLNAGKVFAEKYGVDSDRVTQLFKKHSGIPRKNLFQVILNNLNLDFNTKIYNELSQDFSNLNVLSAKQAGLFDEVLEILDHLKTKFVLYVSSSSNHNELVTIVNDVGMTSYFAGVWGSVKGFNKGKEHFDKILIEQNCTLNNLLFIGDDHADQNLAKEAGVSFIKICRSEEEQVQQIKTLLSLKYL
ncbi:hypothetical protein BVY03_03370 [bacterium K02(2017)]|nr:hypothetical protein BVY03_03370 [bacterium K02(2017)]